MVQPHARGHVGLLAVEVLEPRADAEQHALARARPLDVDVRVVVQHAVLARDVLLGRVRHAVRAVPDLDRLGTSDLWGSGRLDRPRREGRRDLDDAVAGWTFVSFVRGP